MIKTIKKSSGQAVIEYVLLLVTMVIIFSAIFSQVKKVAYYIWICRVTPVIEVGCPNCQDKDLESPINCSSL